MTRRALLGMLVAVPAAAVGARAPGAAVVVRDLVCVTRVSVDTANGMVLVTDEMLADLSFPLEDLILQRMHCSFQEIQDAAIVEDEAA